MIAIARAVTLHNCGAGYTSTTRYSFTPPLPLISIQAASTTGLPVRPLLGITFKILSVVLFVVMMIFIKLLSAEDVPLGQVIFLRALIGLAAIMLVYRLAGRFHGTFRIHSRRKHINWALTAGVSMCCWFTAITLIPLPEATAISFVMPLVTVVLAWLILKEQVRIYRWMAVLIGLTGVCIIVWPRLNTGTEYQSASAIGALLALSAASLWGLAQIFMRRLTATESSGSAVMSFSIATLLLALFTLPFGWVVPTLHEWLLLVCCGIAGGGGQFFVAESLRYGEASTIATFEYLNFPVASIAAAIVFSEYPDSNVWLGLPFVVCAGLFVIYRERQLSRQQQR